MLSLQPGNANWPPLWSIVTIAGVGRPIWNAIGTISSTGRPASQLCRLSHQETSAVMERKMSGPS
jgi:hypothetical protein